MAKHTLDMVLEYAKVFEENMDKGDAESNQKWLRDLAKSGGQTVVNAYFTSEEQIAYMEEQGFERMAVNPQTGAQVDRIKDGNAEFGIGKYIQLKRKFSDLKEIKNRKTGEFEEIEFGGLPKVVDLRDMDNKRLWSLEEDGPLGNGTKAKVMFDMYKGTTLRLEAIGVTEHVAYEQNDVGGDDNDWVKVA